MESPKYAETHKYVCSQAGSGKSKGAVGAWRPCLELKVLHGVRKTRALPHAFLVVLASARIALHRYVYTYHAIMRTLFP